MKNYKVHILIKGATHRPPYEGFVPVMAKNETDARELAIRKLLGSGVWWDASRSDIKILKLEYLP